DPSESPDSFFIPIGVDPSPGPYSGTPRSTSDSAGAKKDKDYFGVPKSSSGSSEKRSDSHASTPHIAFQEKGRQHSSDHDVTQAKSQPRNQSKGSDQDQSKTSPSGNEFQLQDAPRTKSLASRSNSS